MCVGGVREGRGHIVVRCTLQPSQLPPRPPSHHLFRVFDAERRGRRGPACKQAEPVQLHDPATPDRFSVADRSASNVGADDDAGHKNYDAGDDG